MKRPLRIVAIHDLSTFGRCALTVVIPILSSMGIQVCPMPTVLMSTHTGGFDGIKKVDCSDFSEQCLQHYKELEIELEGIYSGYLGDTLQLEGALSFYRAYPNALKVADPVLGDNGRFYGGITADLIDGMKRIVAEADVITPNITEAAFLTGTAYKTEYSAAELAEITRRLSVLTGADIVITGVACKEHGRGNVCCGSNQSPVFLPAHYRHACFDGTGDCFASVLTGALLKGEALAAAATKAADFVEYCMDLSAESGEPKRNGIFLEAALPWLNQAQNNTKPKPIELTEV